MIRKRLAPCCLWVASALGTPRLLAEPAEVSAPEASTSTVERCVKEHESARIERLQEHWLEARTAMRACAEDDCPLAIRSDCRTWLEELTQVLPSLLILIERDDDAKEKAQVELDGQLLSTPESPGPIELLPGTHHLRVELPGYPPQEREIVLVKGEKLRVARLRFARPSPLPALPAPTRSAPDGRPTTPPLAAPEPPSHAPRRPTPNATYWLAGGAIVALGTSGALLGSALSSLSHARDTCAPGCSESERTSIRTRLLLADGFGGAGLLLAGLSIYAFVTRPTLQESRTGTAIPQLVLSPHGAGLSFARSF